MKSTLALALFCASASAAVSRSLSNEEAFVRYLAKHNKSYLTSSEYQQRFENFVKTDQYIKAFNAESESARLGHNKFSDWTADEKARLTSGLNMNDEDLEDRQKIATQLGSDLPTDDLPDSVDWVEFGAMQPIQDQGQCGACWAFAAISSIEGAHFISTGESQKLSEQECVDCDTDSFGCKGGWPDNCFWYVHDNNGVNTESAYPYTAWSDDCFAPFPSAGYTTVTAVNHVTAYDDLQMMASIANAPVAITIGASANGFLNYESGVLKERQCYQDGLFPTKLDHAVTAVGYGHDDESGLDYYLVRNSWGTEWGEAGYVKLQRTMEGGNGTCGMLKISNWVTTGIYEG